MRATRFMSFLFVFLSAAFFFSPEFRLGLQTPAFLGRQLEWLAAAGEVSQRQMTGLVQEAEQKRDARRLAFAVSLPKDWSERARLAQRAAELDAQWTWVAWLPDKSTEPKLAQQIAGRLQAWDPDNAVPYLFQAEQIFETEKLGNLTGTDQVMKLAEQTAWRGVMAKAFAAPRYDAYTLRRFDLQRQALRELGWDRPAVALYLVASMPIPNLLNTRQYGRLLIELGKQAEAAGRLDEAAGHYWKVAHFGERMHLHGISLIEKLIGEALQQMAYTLLVALLPRQGRNEEAASLQHLLEEMKMRREVRAGKDPVAQSSNYNWTALLVNIFAGLVIVFIVFTAVTVGYVNGKRWIRPQHRGRLYQLMTVAENYAPLLLFLACLGLYVSSFPFGQNFKHYMTATGAIHDLEPFFYNVFPVPDAVPFRLQLPVGNPFRPLAWYALGGLALAVICSLVAGRRTAAPPASGG